jgi:hypothetical protein
MNGACPATIEAVAANPLAMIVPIGVPSLFRISKLIVAAAFRAVSAIRLAGEGPF